MQGLRTTHCNHTQIYSVLQGCTINFDLLKICKCLASITCEMQRLALYAGDSKAISPFFKEEVIGYCVLCLVEVLNCSNYQEQEKEVMS